STRRHGRACPGHPRLLCIEAAKTWMAGTRHVLGPASGRNQAPGTTTETQVMRAKFLDKKTIAELTARMYLDTGAVRFMTDTPFTSRSGGASLVYNAPGCLMPSPDVRSALMDSAVHTTERDIGRHKINAVAGGETAGIPFAAWVADRMHLPMQYVRKK